MWTPLMHLWRKGLTMAWIYIKTRNLFSVFVSFISAKHNFLSWITVLCMCKLRLRTHEKLIFLNDPLQVCNEGWNTLESLYMVIIIIQKKHSFQYRKRIYHFFNKKSNNTMNVWATCCTNMLCNFFIFYFYEKQVIFFTYLIYYI
jgi:hypothetical protein